MILVVQNSKELDEQRTLFLESMSLCVSIVKPRTSSHQTIAEALDELQVSPGSSSTEIILLQKRISGPFLKRPGNLPGPKSNSSNYNPLSVKSCFIVSDERKGKITAKSQSKKTFSY